MPPAGNAHYPPRAIGVEEQIDRVLAVPAGQHDDARAQLEHAAQQRLDLGLLAARSDAPIVDCRRPLAEQGARLGYVGGKDGSQRQDLLRKRALPLHIQQPRSRLGDHHGIHHDRRAGRQLAQRRRNRANRRGIASIPTFTASTPMSEMTARTCASTISGGTGWIALTPSVFCAVIAVIAAVPCTPQRANAFRSAWIPAPPPESDPAIVSARGVRAVPISPL